MTQPLSSQASDGLPNGADATAPAMVVIGVGSPHGEDATGWEVIDAVGNLLPAADGQAARISLRKAVVPYDLLDWLETAAVTHLIDASLDATPAVRRFRVHAAIGGELQLTLADEGGEEAYGAAFPQTRSRSSHQLDLASILRLAAALGRLPSELVLWTVSVESTDKRQSISQATHQRIALCAQRIAHELRQRV